MYARSLDLQTQFPISRSDYNCFVSARNWSPLDHSRAMLVLIVLLLITTIKNYNHFISAQSGVFLEEFNIQTVLIFFAFSKL